MKHKNTFTIIAVSLFAALSINLHAETPLEIHGKYGVPNNYDMMLEREGYIVGYDFETKNPAFSAYRLTPESIAPTPKRINSFAEDKEVPSEYRSTLKDYKKNGRNMDRGHLAPNAAMDFSSSSQRESFLLSNMVPQLAGHNRNGWRILEEQVRELVEVTQGEVYVVSGVLYDAKRDFIGDGVEIPDWFYKAIYRPSTQDTIAYLIPHQAFGESDLPQYAVSVNTLESFSQLDFFNLIDDAIEEQIED